FSVKDLLTKKQVTVHITPDAQMHALPENMARMIAARLKGTSPAGGGSGAPGGGAAAGGQQRAWSANGQAGGPGGGGGGGFGGGAARSGDMQALLSRTPVVHFSDLKKGDAVMLV